MEKFISIQNEFNFNFTDVEKEKDFQMISPVFMVAGWLDVVRLLQSNESCFVRGRPSKSRNDSGSIRISRPARDTSNYWSRKQPTELGADNRASSNEVTTPIAIMGWCHTSGNTHIKPTDTTKKGKVCLFKACCCCIVTTIPPQHLYEEICVNLRLRTTQISFV